MTSRLSVLLYDVADETLLSCRCIRNVGCCCSPAAGYEPFASLIRCSAFTAAHCILAIYSSSDGNGMLGHRENTRRRSAISHLDMSYGTLRSEFVARVNCYMVMSIGCLVVRTILTTRRLKELYIRKASKISFCALSSLL